MITVTINKSTYQTVLDFTEANVIKFAASISAHVLNINLLNNTALLTQGIKGGHKIIIKNN